MLRFDHMPSDFNPVYLFLGEADDLRALVRVLREFAMGQCEIVLDDQIPGARSREKLSLVPAEQDFGMRQADGKFEWKLNSWQAEQIADRIDALTPEGNKSGSEIFEVGSDGEIPVKVSRGEFTDDFLITKM